MKNFTILTEEQVFGDNCLDIIKKYGAACTPSDFATLLGASRNTTNKNCEWWTKTSGPKVFFVPTVYAVDSSGNKVWNPVSNNFMAVRPAVAYSSIKDEATVISSNSNIKEVVYGEYPQSIATPAIASLLELSYLAGKLKFGNKDYITGFVKLVSVIFI